MARNVLAVATAVTPMEYAIAMLTIPHLREVYRLAADTAITAILKVWIVLKIALIAHCLLLLGLGRAA